GPPPRTARPRRARAVCGADSGAVHRGAHRVHALCHRRPLSRPRWLHREDRVGCLAVADCAGRALVRGGRNGRRQRAPPWRAARRPVLRVTGGYMRHLRLRLRDARGTSLVEAALITPLLLFLTLSIVDFGALFYCYLALE